LNPGKKSRSAGGYQNNSKLFQEAERKRDNFLQTSTIAALGGEEMRWTRRGKTPEENIVVVRVFVGGCSQAAEHATKGCGEFVIKLERGDVMWCKGAFWGFWFFVGGEREQGTLPTNF